MHQETLVYEADGLTMRSRLFFNPEKGPRPGVLVFPEAFGLDRNAISRAERLADLGYAALACDLHGNGEVVDDLQQAMTMLQPLFDDPSRTRARAAAALKALAERPEVDAARIAAVSYCFPASLELARAGAPIKAAVGFHTSLATKSPVSAPDVVKSHVLVCIGADDPFIPPEQRAQFEAEMKTGKVDWQMALYGGAVHSFTNPEAGRRNMPDAIRYNPEAAERAWASALDLFDRVLK